MVVFLAYSYQETKGCKWKILCREIFQCDNKYLQIMTKKLRNCSIDSVKNTKIKLTRKQTFENKVRSDFRISRKMVISSTLKKYVLKKWNRRLKLEFNSAY